MVTISMSTLVQEVVTVIHDWLVLRLFFGITLWIELTSSLCLLRIYDVLSAAPLFCSSAPGALKR